VIAAIVIPGFELRAALRERPGLARRAAALAPLPGREPLLGPVTATAEAGGVKPGMRLGEALATCPSLVLVEQDPATAEDAWEGIVRRLEDAGFAVEPHGLGTAYFETKGVERLYGGVQAALHRALAAVGAGWDARAGAAARRFAALAAASVARAGQVVVVADGEEAREFLAPLPLSLLPLEDVRRDELQELGVRRLGQLAELPGAAVAERLGRDGRQAWTLARGRGSRRVDGRRPPAEVVEQLDFPEAVGNELTLRRALHVLVDRLLASPDRDGRFLRKLALVARLAGGGSWRRTVTLRDPAAERDRLRAALGPKLAELPAPVTRLALEAVELSDSRGSQLALVGFAEGDELDVRLKDGLRQVRASTGGGTVCTVVDIAPWSRLPEQRALLVPRDE
jgi:nucleotidyltransferase/DNA polymerase involved in DNA repair